MGDGTRIIKLNPPSTISTLYSLAGYSNIGLISDSSETYMHAFSYSSTPQIMMTIFSMGTIFKMYQLQVQCASTTVDAFVKTFHFCNYENSPSASTLVFSEGTRFFIIQNDYTSSTFTSSTLHDLSAPLLYGRGLQCLRSNLFYALMWGTYSAESNRIIIAEVNSKTQNIIYRRYLQQVAQTHHGIIYENNKFFIGSQIAQLYIAPSTLLAPWSVNHGIIQSPHSTCQSLDEFTYPIVTLTANAFPFTPTSYSYASSTLAILDLTATFTSPSDIDQSIFDGQFTTQCSSQTHSPSPSDFTTLQSTPNTLHFYTIETSKVFPILPFTAANQVPGDPVFSYSLKYFDGPVGGVTVAQNNGEIRIADVSALMEGEYTIVVEGRLQDCQSVSVRFKLIGEFNVAPRFERDHLEDIYVVQGQVSEFVLPQIIDPNIGQVVTVSISSLDFIELIDLSLHISPSQTGKYLLIISLSDSLSSSTYPLSIHILSPPPYTISPHPPPHFTLPILPLLTIQLNSTFIYQLPPVEEGNVSVSVELHEAAVFTEYQSGLLVFKAKKGNAGGRKEYEITVVLVRDGKESRYNIKVVIGDGDTHQNESSQIASPPTVTYPCSFRLLRLTSTALLHLKLTCPTSPLLAPFILTHALKETDLEVTTTSNQFDVSIVEVRERGIVVVKVGNGFGKYVGEVVTVRIAKDVKESIGNGQAMLPKGSSAQSYIPYQYTEGEGHIAALLISSKQYTCISMLIFSFFLWIFFSFAMNLIFSMLNDISFLISLSLISIPIPGIASSIQSLLLQIIYMDLLMTDKWLSPQIEKIFLQEELEQDSALNEYFEDQGFASRLAIFNLGSTLIFLGIQILLLLFTALAFLVTKSSILQQIHSRFQIFSARKWYTYLKGRVLQQSVIAFVIQQFQPLLMSSLINITTFTELEGMVSYGVKISYSLSVVILAILGFSIITFTILIRDREVRRDSIGTLIEGLRDSGPSSYWTILTLLKWSILCLTLILLSHYPAQQLQLLTALSILSTALQLGLKPQTSLVEQWMSFFNELAATFYLYTLLCLSLSTLQTESGLALVCIIIFTLLVNLLKVGALSVMECTKRYRRRKGRVRKCQESATESREEKEIGEVQEEVKEEVLRIKTAFKWKKVA
ncbi:hypothetical protein FGO68_gene11756 [Halteria grandinella]|uniref:Uncharacterized protein n=1 Tax=Halteria grandinella TaxID=5974 RepID=A0A8J8P272_HALGN|nr:hypothetical protein FGO68_gene11756 [Halteria grandinella]